MASKGSEPVQGTHSVQAGADAERKETTKAYRGILKSAALLGSARAVSMVVGLVRVKFLALIVGPIGIGLLGTFDSIVTTTIYISILGVPTSGVREVALANAGADRMRTARTAFNLRRLSWSLGLVGMLAMAALAWPLSRLTFNNSSQGMAILILSPAILLTSTVSGLKAVIQGMRRIADLAKLTVISAVIQATVIVALVYVFGTRGIAPAFGVSALLNLIPCKWYLRRIKLPSVHFRWGETLRDSGAFVRLGIGLTYALLLSSLVNYAIRALIARDLSLEALGIYLCAFGLSAKFVGFLLEALQKDFYPRLSAAAEDHPSLNRLVNQQTEIVLLLAMPGLLITLAFAPWLVRLIYSAQFDEAAVLLRWFVLGCLARVIWAPMGYVQLAKSRGLLYGATVTGINIVKILLIFVLLNAYGLTGIVLAYVGNEVFQILAMLAVCRRLTDFKWSSDTVGILLVSVALALTSVAASFLLNRVQTSIVVGLVSIAVSLYCLRQLVVRLGPDHRLVLLAGRLPLLNGFLGKH